MTILMVIWRSGAAVFPGLLSIGDVFTTWLEPSLGCCWLTLVAPEIDPDCHFASGLAGAAIAWNMYGRSGGSPPSRAGNALTRAARVDLYQDTVNALFMTPGIALAKTATLGDDKD